MYYQSFFLQGKRKSQCKLALATLAAWPKARTDPRRAGLLNSRQELGSTHLCSVGYATKIGSKDRRTQAEPHRPSTGAATTLAVTKQTREGSCCACQVALIMAKILRRETPDIHQSPVLTTKN